MSDIDRDPGINALCPPRRQADDTLVTQANRDARTAWEAEARKAQAWLDSAVQS